MCRDQKHGGRRCTRRSAAVESAARQARRLRARERASQALDAAEKLEAWQPIAAAALAAQARMLRLTDASDCDADLLAREAELDELERDLLALDGLIEEQRATGLPEPTWASTLGSATTDALLWFASNDNGRTPASPPRQRSAHAARPWRVQLPSGGKRVVSRRLLTKDSTAWQTSLVGCWPC